MPSSGRFKVLFATVVVVITCWHDASAQLGPDGKTTSRSDRSARTLALSIPRIEKAPKIDGHLDDDSWQAAVRISGFTEVEPVPGGHPSDSTVAFGAYDKNHLYLAVIAYGDPKALRVWSGSRDQAYVGAGYDGITFRFDTYNEGRRAYVLQVSPQGTVGDGLMDEGGYPSFTENFVWSAAAKVTPTGYVVEISVPFSSFNFPDSKNLAIGFNIFRDYGLYGHQDSWAPRIRGNPCDICQQGILLDIQDVSTKKRVDVRPYVVAAEAGGRELELGMATQDSTEWPAYFPEDWRRSESTRRVGADLRVAVSSAFTLNAAIHPDFSQVEAAPEQVRVNTRFAIYYPEQRPFFTAESQAFQTGTGIFYSRNVADPSIGVRLGGQQGKYNVAALYAHDLSPGYLHYQGYEYSFRDASVGGSADDAVLRVKRSVGDDSYFGVTAVRRDHAGGFNQVIGGDFRARRGRWTLLGEYARSIDQLPTMWLPVDTAGQCPPGYLQSPITTNRCESSLYNGQKRNGSAVEAKVTYTGKIFNVNIGAGHTDQNFRAELSNIIRVGVTDVNSSVYGIYQTNRRIGSITLTASSKMTFGPDNQLLDLYGGPHLSIQTRGGTSIMFGPSFIRTKFLDSTLDSRSISTGLGFRLGKLLELSGGMTVGRAPIFDFSGPRVGANSSIYFTAYAYPTPQLTLWPTYQHVSTSEIDGGPEVARADLFSLTVQYQPRARLGFRIYSQFSDQWTGLTANPFFQRDKYLQSSLLCTYELVPTSFLYIGVNDERRRFAPPIVAADQLLVTGTRVFLKLSYLFQM